MNLSFSIKTHRPGKEYSGVHFFILNKGLNSGKPLDEPCPNCYVCECTNEEDKEALYWICFALWQSHQFHQHLIGSVILYIRKKEFYNLVRDAFIKAQAKPELFEKALVLLKTVNEKDLHFQELAAVMKKMKREVARGLVR
jgi:uncharacterized protein YcgL (UPF0745 family)